MKKTKFLGILFAAASVLGLNSCLDSDKTNGLESTTSFSRFINVFNNSDDVMSGIGYQLTQYFDKNKAKIEITGLKLPDGTSYTTVVLDNLDISYNSSEWLIISGNNIQASGSNGLVSNLFFDTFSFQAHDNILTVGSTQSNYPYYNITYTINNTYHVRSLPTGTRLTGETTVTTQATGDQFVNEDAQYLIAIDTDTKKAQVQIVGAKFADKMPAMNLVFKDLPYTVSYTGDIVLSSADFTPYKMDTSGNLTPYADFPITDFTMTYNPARGMTSNFVCTLNQRTGNAEDAPVISIAYDVQVVATLKNPKE